MHELQVRGYRTWFGARSARLTTASADHRARLSDAVCACLRADLDNLKGSTVDALSDAVENAEVMLSCISLAYKESASESTKAIRCRIARLTQCSSCVQIVGSQL